MDECSMDIESKMKTNSNDTNEPIASQKYKPPRKALPFPSRRLQMILTEMSKEQKYKPPCKTQCFQSSQADKEKEEKYKRHLKQSLVRNMSKLRHRRNSQQEKKIKPLPPRNPKDKYRSSQFFDVCVGDPSTTTMPTTK